MTTQRIDSATRASNISHNQLQHRRSADDLCPKSVLRPANRINDGAGLLHVAVFSNRSVEIGGFQKLILGNAGNPLHHLRRIARILLLQQLKDRAWMLQRQVIRHIRRQHRRRLGRFGCLCPSGTSSLIALAMSSRSLRATLVRLLRILSRFGTPWLRSVARRCQSRRGNDRGSRGMAHVAAFLIVPRRLVIDLRSRIEAGIQSIVRQLETILHDEGGVGVVDEVILGDTVVVDRILDHATEESDVSAGANLAEEIGGGGGAGKPRINHDHLGVACTLRLNRPLESARMVLRRIAAHDQHHVGILDIGVAIGHGPASKRWSQT